MLSGTAGSPVASSSCLIEATWENALLHFRRTLMECGSPLEIEHSQRLGLLFSRRVGSTDELTRWASIFNAENVPATSLLLKALTSHDQWHTATKLLQLNKDSTAMKELSEVLAQCLTSRGLWQQTLQLVDLLEEQAAQQIIQGDSLANTASNLVSSYHDDDSYQMAQNPAFLPEEERSSSCGFVAAVAQGFPGKRNWEEAVKMLERMQSVVDAKTTVRLFEYEIARCVHDGEKHREIIDRSRGQPLFRTSPSLLRSLLHCAIAVRDVELTIECLQLLSSFGRCAIATKLFEQACALVISSDSGISRKHLSRFETVICAHAACVQNHETQKQISVFCADYDLKIPVFLPPSGAAAASSKRLSQPVLQKSVSQLDRVATVLISQNKWKEALELADSITKQMPSDEDEVVIVEMLRACGDSWERALQLFQS